MRWLCFAAIWLLTASPAFAQAPGVIWRDPGPMASRDLFWGNASPDRAPKPPFTFVQEKTGGASAKVTVTDAAGRSWDVKFGHEVHAEIAAGRLLSAFGYPVEEMYFVSSGRIEGVKDLDRADEHLKDGAFTNARFELNDPKVKEGDGWAIASNPFTGSKEMSGLLILFALINNWDTDLAKNQAIYTVATENGTEQWYMADDIGASFGRFVLESPIKWNLEEYRKDKLIASVEPDAIVLNYRAYGTPPTRIPLDHARWFAGMSSQLTREQVRRAFEAAGTPAGEIDGFVDVFMAKLGELHAAVGNR